VDVTNAYADDGLYAADMDSGHNSKNTCNPIKEDSHTFYDFDLNVPAGATITGIEILVDAWTDNSSVGSPRLCGQLIWDGGADWSYYVLSPVLDTVEARYIIGGNTWGESWDASDFDNSSFRVRIISNSGSPNSDFFLEWVAVRINYDSGAQTLGAGAAAGLLLPLVQNGVVPSIPPLPTPTATATSTTTATATATATGQATAPATATATGTTMATAIATPTPTPTATATTTATATATPTATSTATPTSTATDTPTPTATATVGGDTTGWHSPRSNTPGTGGDGDGFEVDPTNAYADGGGWAEDNDSGHNPLARCNPINEDSHLFYDFDLVIPPGATVTSIEVLVDAWTSDNSSGTPALCAQLVWDGGADRSDYELTPMLGTSEARYILGGDTWDETWDPADFDNSSFRVRIISYSSDPTNDFFLDWVAVRITYE
jgi:hypothetical protein